MKFTYYLDVHPWHAAANCQYPPTPTVAPIGEKTAGCKRFVFTVDVGEPFDVDKILQTIPAKLESK